MFDDNMMFRVAADGALTADEAETTHIVDLGPGGTPLGGSVIWVHVPSVSGTDTLAVTVYADDTAAVTSPDASFVFPTITAAGLYKMKINTHRRYLGMKFDGTDVDGGGFSFGVVQAGVAGHESRLTGGARP